MGFDEDEFRNTIADRAEELVREWIESEMGAGHIECDCGSRSFDVETWKNANGNIEAAAVCRDCNERVPVNVDISDLDDIRG